MSANSITHERRKVFYPSPKNDALFKGYLIRNDIGVSECINMLLKEFFNNISPEERLILLKYARENNAVKE